MRLINGDQLIEDMRLYGFKGNWLGAKKFIENSDEVKAIVPIRCGECVHYGSGCLIAGKKPEKYDFCGRAVKK